MYGDENTPLRKTRVTVVLLSCKNVKLSRKPGLNIYKIGFMLKNGQNTIFFTLFTLKTVFLCEFYSPQA